MQIEKGSVVWFGYVISSWRIHTFKALSDHKIS